MGKRTLAQLVYNNEKVVKHFGDQRMWICASNDFIVPKLLNQMIQSLTGDKSDIDNIEGIVRKLAAKLNGKKYLLVLDDVWNENQDKWECMRNSLVGIGGSKGSKIISTARSMHVVSTMRTSPSLTYHLNQLSENESWTMFWKRAFANGGPIETSNLVAIGRKMVEKCKGVPLAIESLGGLMYSRQYNYEQVSIENSEIWSSTEIKSGIQPILRLSFDHLPSLYLKHCFAYCFISPKDFNIQKDKSIQLWMAQGYLQPSLGSNLEMKDVDVSKGNCLALASTASEANCHPEVQHLSFTLMGNVSFEIPKKNVGKLRTLFSEGSLPKNIYEFECIRALNLENVRELPDSICKFIQLQTLRVPFILKKLPEKFYELVSLRHFCFHETIMNRELMPMTIGTLTSLQTLPFFVVGEDKGHKIEELGSLSKLRGELMIYNLKQVKGKKDAEKANISRKLNIHELGFH
ncbi:hypothetical protein CsSME_00020285 [Camellia sinensis var. sinensis]